MPVIKKDSFNFIFNSDACKECEARCCTGESGYIYVTKEEIHAISESLEMHIGEFADRYLFKKDYKFSIKERKNGESYECIFYDSDINGCSIYETRPTQCSTFPFWDYYKTRVDELKHECPGVQDA